MLQTIKWLLPVASITGLLWLYYNPHLSVVSRSSQAPSSTAPAAVSSQPSPSPAKPTVTAKSSVAKPKSISTTTSSSLDPTLEPTRLEIRLKSRAVIFYLDDIEMNRYPIAIGRSGWETPQGKFKVLQMQKNPNWINPLTDQKVPAGDPQNPLGSYWIGFWTDGRDWIGFHGTPDRHTVGQAISHGCIRMYNEDITNLFYQINPGTQVVVME
ncbi:L,D-transpeptidase [Pantanalinema rosaneae CENA516]|uniref:L,D-transpeptidase n=1 Tax=Pantanalinema rosaneae TaxID=1620701 RepID=UPI003D6F33DC